MSSSCERSYNFTPSGEACLFRTAEQLATPDNLDAGMILSLLKDQICFIPFSDYLKRYVYLRSGMTGSFRKVETETYVQTVLDAFRETGTPGSVKHPETRLISRIRSWFNQAAVRRDVVLLLGFGLSMPFEEVNAFLTKAIHDHCLNEEDPWEGLCAYCYRNGYRYAKMEQLWHDSIRQPADPEGKLVPTSMTLRTRETFNQLYREAMVCLQKNRFPGANKPNEVFPHDLEDVLCSSIPRDRHGNLIPELHSVLRDTISGKRFSRQHIHELLQQNIEPTRYDLITLSFFLLASQVDRVPDPKSRYLAFREKTDSILAACGFGSLYPADPYDCFILICILSVDPLGTYADVQELSYNPESPNQ